VAERTQVELELVTQFQKARQDTQKFADEANKHLSTISMASVFTAVTEGFELARESLETVIGFFEKCSEEAAKTEESVRLLNNAMRVTGEFTEAASEGMQHFAEHLERTTTATDDQILASLTLAKNFGLSNLEARKLTETAADLAAFTGQDLNSATQELAATYNGFISRSLGKMIPELRALTKAQLENGDAVAYLANRVRGSAADALNSFAGQMKQREKDIEDFQKAIGRHVNIIVSDWIRGGHAVVQAGKDIWAAVRRDSLAADSALQEDIFANVSKAIRKNAPASLKAILDEDKATAKAKAARIKAEQDEENRARLEAFKTGWVEKRKEIELKSLTDLQRIVKQYDNEEGDVHKAASLGLIKTKTEEQKLILGLEKEKLEKIKELISKPLPEIDLVGLTEIQKIQVDYDHRRDTLLRAVKLGQFNDDVERIKILSRLQQEEDKKIAAAKAKLNESLASNPGGAIGDFITGNPDGALKNGGDVAALGAGVGVEATKGQAGALDLVSSVAGAIANAFVPGIGAAVKQIIDALSQGGPAVREMISSFIEAIPDIIANIVDGVLGGFDQIYKELPKFIGKLFEAIPKIIQSIGKFVPEFLKTFLTLVPQIVEEFAKDIPIFIDALIDAIPEIIEAFIKAIPQIIVALVKSVPKIIEEFAKGMLAIPEKFAEKLLGALGIGKDSGFGKILGGGIAGPTGGGGGGFLGGITGGIGQVLGGVGDVFGFAEGGTTPKRASLEHDGGFAKIGANETIIDSDLTDWLRGMKSSGQGIGGKQPDIVINVGLQQFARLVFDARRAGYQT
jgi:hypothetical protein